MVGEVASERLLQLADGKWEGIVAGVRRDGSHFSARVVLTPRRNREGEPIGFLLISRDISDDIRPIKELEATQAYARSLIESNIDALITTDQQGIITDVNQQTEALTGYRHVELVGLPFKQFFINSDTAEEGIRLAICDGRITNYELTTRGKAGRETVVSYNATAFHDREGRLQGSSQPPATSPTASGSMRHCRRPRWPPSRPIRPRASTCRA